MTCEIVSSAAREHCEKKSDMDKGVTQDQTPRGSWKIPTSTTLGLVPPMSVSEIERFQQNFFLYMFVFQHTPMPFYSLFASTKS